MITYSNLHWPLKWCVVQQLKDTYITCHVHFNTSAACLQVVQEDAPVVDDADDDEGDNDDESQYAVWEVELNTFALVVQEEEQLLCVAQDRLESSPFEMSEI